MFEGKLLVSIGGYEEGDPDYTDQKIEISEKELKKILPAMIHCMCDSFLKVIEENGHPFEGWQIMTLSIDRPDQPSKTEIDKEWERLSKEAGEQGTDFSDAKLDENGNFVTKA